MPIGTLPNEETRKAALFWSLPCNQIDNWRDKPIEQWRTNARDLWPELAPFTNQITSHNQMTPAVYTHGSLRKPFGDRIVHIGDAAHRARPQLGQYGIVGCGGIGEMFDDFPYERSPATTCKSPTTTYKCVSSDELGIYTNVSVKQPHPANNARLYLRSA